MSTKTIQVEIHDDDTPLHGEGAPDIDNVGDLIKYLATVQHRFGKTVVMFRIQWGAHALWVEDAQKKEIASLQKTIEGLTERVAIQSEMLSKNAEKM
jgi:hypothetical protein